MRQIIVIAHDMRSTHNVGSLLRTCEGLGVDKVYLTGYTPHPGIPGDSRLPHIIEKLEQQIDKTALGAASMVPWQYSQDINEVIENLQKDGFETVALEQSPDSTKLPDYKAPQKVALILGTEVTGVPPQILELCSKTVEIPMFGQKESFNVVQSAAMALYHLRFS